MTFVTCVNVINVILFWQRPHSSAQANFGKESMLDVHQLNVFLKAAETLSFTQAARLLHMTQPSVSQHIRGLEEHLGTRLFNRRGRTIALTDAGLALVPMAREMVDRSVNIEESIRSLKDEVHGHLLVACSTTPGKYVLPALLAAFHDYFPQVRVSCHVASQLLALQSLSTGEVHFALASTPPLTHKQIEFQHFATDEIVMIAPFDHPWAAAGRVPPDALYDETFILREETSGTQGVVAQALAGVGVNVGRLEPLLTLGNSEAIALAVQEGLGIGFVSRIVVTKLALENVAVVRIDGANLQRELFFGRHVGRPATTAQNAFWKFVATQKSSELSGLIV